MLRTNNTNSNKSAIDVVIMWVDGSDPEWKKEKDLYSSVNSTKKDDNVYRYRDWNNLQYIFRGIEEFMPWVNKIHFVTAGHTPKWLDISNPRLNIVRHSDYMSAEYYPTFSANPIEINLHRIKNLAEKFILFNDDTFVVRPLRSTIFFTRKGIPRDQVAPIVLTSKMINDVMPHIFLNNNALINQAFPSGPESILAWVKILSPRNGLASSLRSLVLLPFMLKSILPPYVPHLPSPFLKQTYRKVWEHYPIELDKISRNKFRSTSDVNQYLFKQWQIVSGDFDPINLTKISRYIEASSKKLPNLQRALSDKKCKLICINDVAIEKNFNKTKLKINKLLNFHLPNKSSFEL